MSAMSSQSNKIIVTCALTGGAHTPSMSPALPVTPDEMIDQGTAAAEAGAAILHLHARIPETGLPTGEPDRYAPFLTVLKQRTGAVLNLTTGGSATMPVNERLLAAMRFKPEMCSLNMGSINFAFFDAARPPAAQPVVLRTRHPSHDFQRQFMADGSHFQATADRVDWWALGADGGAG